MPLFAGEHSGQSVVGRILLPASALLFLVGAGCSAIPYFAGHPVDLKRAMISNLASPTDNPHGYLWIDLSTLLVAMLLAPVTVWLFRVYRRVNVTIAAGGSSLFGLGLAGAVLFSVRAPFEDGISEFHVYLAYAAFILTTAGTLLLLALATRLVLAGGGGRVLLAATLLHACVLAFLCYLLLGESRGGNNFFEDSSLLHSVALLEWLLCGEGFGCLTLLVRSARTVSGQRS